MCILLFKYSECIYLLCLVYLVMLAVAHTRGAQIFQKSVSQFKIKHHAISILRIYTY